MFINELFIRRKIDLTTQTKHHFTPTKGFPQQTMAYNL
jgi:hypothetical protein